MRIEQLEYLAVITEHSSLRRAAEHLHLSQSALSEAIARMERELGVTLLERQRSGVRITPAGRELLEPMQDVLDAMARLRAAAGNRLAARRLIRLGTVNAGTAALLFPALHEFQAAHPNVTVELRALQMREVVECLEDGSLDVGLINLLDGDDVPAGVEAIRLVSGTPVAVVPAAHPLTAQETVSVADLREERFVGMRPGYLMHRFAHRLFGSELPPLWHATDGAEMGKQMVAAGIGVSVLPDYSVAGDPLERAGIITTRRVDEVEARVTMLALHRRQARVPTAVRDLLRVLVEQAAHRRTA